MQATVEAPLTAGHKALNLLAKYKKTSILTENVDLLQQAAGIEPLFAGSQTAHDLCTAYNLKEIDLIICIGLSHDDRGFIAQYKYHNPYAKIVALDFKSPNYLDNDDRLLQGDTEVNLPMLYNEVILEYNSS